MFIKLFVLLIGVFGLLNAAPLASVYPAPAAITTAHSSQFVARNYNGLALAPAFPAVPAPVIPAPAVVPAPVPATPFILPAAADPFYPYASPFVL